MAESANKRKQNLMKTPIEFGRPLEEIFLKLPRFRVRKII